MTYVTAWVLAMAWPSPGPAPQLKFELVAAATSSGTRIAMANVKTALKGLVKCSTCGKGYVAGPGARAEAGAGRAFVLSAGLLALALALPAQLADTPLDTFA